ncbi:MAG: hypothetical protein AKCLJLPJ_02011 [Fimbriimonadales bacterium]|nr:hypothetical protein [Fimbriimonadales bacterium]
MSALVPKLRFPEFRAAKPWRRAPLGEVTVKADRRNKGGVSYPVYSISNKAGFVPQGEQFDGVESKARGYDISLYKLIGPNTFAYNPARINVGSLGYSGDLDNIIISSLYVCFKTTEDVDDRFLLQYFDTPDFAGQVNNTVEGGIRSYLFYENLSIISTSLPSVDEQRKIADCLTSLDELIAAEGQRLEALRKWKKALLQNLFPREGEATPRLRFPEYHSAGEWEEKPMAAISRVVRGGSPRPIDQFLTSDPTGLRWLKIGDVQREAKYITATTDRVRSEALSKTRVVYPGDFILSNSMSFGRPYISQIETCIHDGWIAVTNIARDLDREFLYYSMLCDRSQRFFTNQAAGSGVQNLNIDIVQGLRVSLPTPAEQSRIASCLGSLDTLITEQAKKLDTLKTHKQGLMQGLFPATEEQNRSEASQ